MQPATVLSAQRAVAEIGFEYLLGPVNVYKGTTFHKRVIKEDRRGPRNASRTMPW